jgi:hypothetical protein
MPLTFSRHPSYETLNDFTDAAADPARARVADHLADCADCRAAVQTLRSVRAALNEPGVEPLPAALRDRVLGNHADVSGIILPVNDGKTNPRRSWIAIAAAAAAVVVAAVFADGMLSPSQQADAGDTSGTMTLAPAMPQMGEHVHVIYEAPTSLAHFQTLILRARLRTASSRAYEVGVPVKSIAKLVRMKSGTYAADIALPDSVVFAAMVVEDSSAVTIDDNNKRAWELLVTANGNTPLLAALDQRANDMMGRSFREGEATTRRMVALYPDSVQGWIYLHAFQNWAGVGHTDSVLAVHRAALAHLNNRWRQGSSVPGAMLGRLAWYASGVDSLSASYWRARLMSEAPTDGFALQWRLFDRLRLLGADHDTAAALQGLDTLWRQRTADRAPQIAGTALSLAVRTKDVDLINRWGERVDSLSRDHVSQEIFFADEVSEIPALSALSVERLRRLLPIVDSPESTERYLTETRAGYAARLALRKGRTLALLGGSLITSGERRGGLDTLELAARSGWDLGIFQAIRNASLAAGDSNTAWMMTARMVADPSTNLVVRDSLNRSAQLVLGNARWSRLRDDASHLFASRILERSKMQSVVGTPRLRDFRGTTIPLAQLATGKVTVVAFWSRYCGWALDDLDNIGDVAQRLSKTGGQLLLVVDDESETSPALLSLLASHKVRLLPYVEVDHSATKAFNNWGTPQYYVLDEHGRVRFDVVSEAREALVRAEALRLSKRGVVTEGP